MNREVWWGIIYFSKYHFLSASSSARIITLKLFQKSSLAILYISSLVKFNQAWSGLIKLSQV